MSTGIEVFHRYCCKDSAVTLEICKKLDAFLQSNQVDHYKFNVELLHPLLYMELRGIRYNAALAQDRLSAMQQHIWTFQQQLDEIARSLDALRGIDFSQPVLPQVQKLICYKRNPERPKEGFVADYFAIQELLAGQASLSEADKGRISSICKCTMNTKSKVFKDFLYKTCKLPTQWKKDPGTKEMRVTTDYEALLKLTKHHDHPALKIALELSRLRTRAQMLAIKSIAGRMHTSYNLVGSETGRVTSGKANLFVADGKVGANMQTIPDDWNLEDEDHPLTQGMRDLFMADEGCYLGKLDLKGADGWTVGAYMAMLGDRTMLDDLLAGLKPAQIVAYILKHGATEVQRHAKDRTKLKELVSEIKKEDWEYFVSKQGIWGTCLTADHEVLTPYGWTPISRVTTDYDVATWDMATRSIQFQKPTAKIEQNYTGNLYSFEGNAMSQLVTADHRMPYMTNDNLKTALAADAYNIKGASFPLSGKWQTFGISCPPASPRLIAAIMSDGSYNRSNRLTFCFRKTRKIERIRQLLEKDGITYKVSTSIDKRDGKVQTYIRCNDAPVVSKVCGAWMLKWDSNALNDFVDEYVHWDGTRSGSCRTLFSVYKNQLDWIATFCRLTDRGFVYQGSYVSGKGSVVHRMSVNARQYASSDSLKKEIKAVENEQVYCLTVPTGYFLVRRNNKISVTGNCYTMGPRKLAERVFVESDGKVNLSEQQARDFQAAIFVRYKVKTWHQWMQRQLDAQSYPAKLTAPNGFTRRFFGRPREILGEALAHMPQVITTYATLQAAHKLWTDPENRIYESDRTACKLRVEPIHQVHDELLVQWRIEDTSWATRKIVEWFDNPIVVAGQKIVIPFEGSYGTNWAMDKLSKVGSI